jgi:hypothetical protein
MKVEEGEEEERRRGEGIAGERFRPYQKLWTVAVASPL